MTVQEINNDRQHEPVLREIETLWGAGLGTADGRYVEGACHTGGQVRGPALADRIEMIPLTYRGYTAEVGFDAEDDIFFGRLAGIRDGIGFHGSTTEELEAAFREAVDDYLDLCARIGKQPQTAVHLGGAISAFVTRRV